MRKINTTFIGLLLSLSASSMAQAWEGAAHAEKLDLGKGISYRAEAAVMQSIGHTPLWMNANKHGLSSLESSNGFLRGTLIRPLSVDSARKWGVGYGVDAAVAYGFTSKLIVQQAFAQLRWLHGTLTVGSKEHDMELKNNRLSSGAQALGINARPVPQVRLALADYWTLPFGKGWLHLKGHIAYGQMTDDNWQHEFTSQKTKYADKVLFHSKAGYFKIGNEERFMPLSLELGLEMASTFGGTAYRPLGDGTMETVVGRTGLKAMWQAFLPGGGEVVEAGTAFQNAEGNQLGAWMVRVNYDADDWRLGLYAEKYFEDHSSMLQLDYDGYGSGENWNVKEKRKFFVYDLKDWLLGFELNFKRRNWLRELVFEYVYSKYQSGPVYHDHNATRNDHISGRDNNYNHYIYTGWQHWGQVMGNPLYRSPLYNDNGVIDIQNSRFVAFHLGLSGQPTERLGYRLLTTYQNGWGTYDLPYNKKKSNLSVMLEAVYRLENGWSFTGVYGMDNGRILGNNYGFGIKVSKRGIFK